MEGIEVQDHSPLMGDEVLDAEDGTSTVIARGHAAPGSPGKDEVERHNLTHLPYRSWCPHCVAARRPNTDHRSSKVRDRRHIPRVCADYLFARKPDEVILTGLAGKLYPSGCFRISL